MKKFLSFALMALAVSFTMVSCSDNDDNSTPEPSLVPYGVTLTMPLNASDATLANGTVTLTNVQTNQTYTSSNFKLVDGNLTDTLNVPVGVYNATVSGNVTYTLNGKSISSPVRASRNNIAVANSSTSTSAKQGVSLALSLYNASDGFVISEIFFTGTLTPEGKSYSDDQYIRIANNTDSTMYADGLAIVQSAFMTTDKEDYTPNLMDSAMTVDAIYVIPGSGHDYPVAAGQEITIALNAVNHKEYNANSIDLSKADFEFYDVVEDAPDADTDNPNVPNLVNWYNTFGGAFTLHNRGFHSYALVRPEVSKDVFNTDFKYTYTYKMTFGEYSFDMDDEGLFIPNSWIVDGVNLSIPSDWQWNVMAASIDAGYTHCGEVDHDQTRFGKAVVRKKENGKWVDTNNSTNDFEADAVPSLLK